MSNTNRRQQRQARNLAAEQNISYQKALVSLQTTSQIELVSRPNAFESYFYTLIENQAKAIKFKPKANPVLLKDKLYALPEIKIQDHLDAKQLEELDKNKFIKIRKETDDYFFEVDVALDGQENLHALINKWKRKQPEKPFDHLIKSLDQVQKEARRWVSRTGLPMPFNQVSWPKGVQPGQMAMLYGKSGSGKTLLQLEYLFFWAKQGYFCLFYSLETSKARMQARLLTMELDISFDAALELIAKADPKATKSKVLKNIHIVDNLEGVKITPQQIKTDIQRLECIQAKPDFVVVDHMGILAAPDDTPMIVLQNDKLIKETLTKELFMTAKETSTFLMIAVQAAKEIPYGQEPSFKGVKEEMFFDYVVSIWREKDAKGKLQKITKSKVAKNRYGACSVEKVGFELKNE